MLGKKERGGRGPDLIVGGLHPHDLMNYNSLTEWECERSIQVTCPSLLPETCEILCRESKAEGSHVKWHTCKGWLPRTGSSGTIKELRAYQKRKNAVVSFFCPLYCCKLMSLAGGRWVYGPGNLFWEAAPLERPNGRVLTDLSLSIRQDSILCVVLRYRHCETSNNTDYWNLAHLDGVSDNGG